MASWVAGCGPAESRQRVGTRRADKATLRDDGCAGPFAVAEKDYS